DTFRALFKDVYDDVVKGRPSETPRYPTFADGYEMLLVCDAIAESARTGKWTQVRRDNEAGIADCSVSREHAG
ncbi:MAG: hypothetical protein K6T28_09685, partial [Acidothermus sp.]|nr:hypothetical protein [Acidothermus sp.]